MLKYHLPVRWSWWVKLPPLLAFQPRFQHFQLSWTIALPCFSLQQRNSTDPKKRTKTHKPLCWNAKLFTGSPLSLSHCVCVYVCARAQRKSSQGKCKANSSQSVEDSSAEQEKAGRWDEVIKSQAGGRVAVDRLQNGEISLVANKTWGPTPKCRDEWALRAMTAPLFGSANYSFHSGLGRGLGREQ